VTVVVSAFTRESANVPPGRFRRDVPAAAHAIVER
jgi:hypothetical protein